MVWLKENMVNIIILLMIGALLYVCIRSLINQKKSGLPSCACGKNCATCALGCAHLMNNKKS